MNKLSLYVALILLGVTAIITQVIFIRELIVVFSGNELSIGIILANLLILEAAGSFFAGRWATKFKSGYLPYTFLQWLLAIILPILIFIVRIIRHYLDLVPGEGINIITIFYASFIILVPIGLINGAQFSFGCKLLSFLEKKGAAVIGRVYVFEAVGSIIGGLFTTYICLQYLNTLQSVYLLSFLNIISALFLIFTIPSENNNPFHRKIFIVKILHTGLFIILIISVFTGQIDYIHQESVRQQWPDYQVISYKNSIYGNVALLERDDQWHLLSNGVTIATLPTPDIASIEDLVHFPLLFHPNPKKIFLLGGGMSGLIDEVLKYQPETVDYAELDPLLIQTVLDYFPDTTSWVFSPKLVNTHYVDGRYFLRMTEKTYDVIILNLPDPSTFVLNRFYTTEFFNICQSRLRKNGILVFQIPGSASYMNSSLATLTYCLISSVSEAFTFHRVIPFEKSIVLASNEKDIIEAGPDVLSTRLTDRHIKTRLFSDLYLNYKLNSTRLEWFQNEIKNISDVKYNTDLFPAALYYNLIFWNSSLSPLIASLYTWFENLSTVYLLLVIIIVYLTVFALQSRGKLNSKLPLIISIFSTGFVGMGLTIILVLTFQAYYGYVYYWIGLIITAFMVGVAVGGLYGSQRVFRENSSVPFFRKTEYSLSLYFSVLILCLFFVQIFNKTALLNSLLPVIILFLTLLCGALVGAQFPVANKLFLDDPYKLTNTAGVIYASDLIGAWAGGIVVTLILIPVLGIIAASITMLFLKLGSAIIFRFSRFK
jgi:spermidine synthase